MTFSDRDAVLLRLERVKLLLERLEQVCAESANARDAFLRAKDEIRRASLTLRVVNRGLYDPDKQQDY
jgi:hypothetical protein